MRNDILLTPNTSLDPTIALAGSNSLKYNESPLLDGTDNQRALATEYNAVGIRYTQPVPLPVRSTTLSSLFSGTVAADAVSNTLPSGWTVVASGGGRYTVTHRLNTTAYAVTVSILSSLLISVANVHDITANSFSVSFFNQTAAVTWAGTDASFMFILALQ